MLFIKIGIIFNFDYNFTIINKINHFYMKISQNIININKDYDDVK